MRSPLAFAGVVVALAIFADVLPSPAAADIRFVHDASGRLISVIDPSSDFVVYRYDATGNLLSVTRQPSTTVSIIEFQPRRGPVGTSVTLQGTGFGPTSGENTVTINGTPVTVTSASAFELTVTIPAGAATGPFALAAPGGSATTAPTTFEVTATNGAPTITNFTPNVGIAGDAFTITGTEFDTVPANDKVLFLTTGTPAVVSTATATSLGVAVPATATSGRLSVSTPGGTAQSAMDLFIPPAGYQYTASSVVFTGRLTVGGPSLPGTIGTAGKIGLVVFDGVAGQRLNQGVTALTITQSFMRVYTPDGTLLTQALIAGLTTLDTPPLPVTGTYQLAIVPLSSFTGNFTLTLSEELMGTITVGGPSVPVTVTRSGQQARLTFESPSGRRLSLGVASITLGNTSVSILNPDGSTLASAGFGTQNNAFDTPPTVATGTHVVLIDQTVATTGSLTLTLSEDVTGTISVGGSSLAVSIGRAGQRARIAFEGVAGQRLSLGLTGTTFPPNPAATVLKPDGTTQAGPLYFPGGGSALDFGPLATTGTYNILIDPPLVDTGQVTLWLSEELTGTITLGGAALPLTITRPGQRARISFSGTTGQRVSLALTGVTVTSLFASLIQPDGTPLGPGQWLSGSSSFLDPKTLASPGPHAFLLDPQVVQTGDLTLTAYDVPADVTETLTINGATLPVSLAVPGQNAVLSVTAPAGTPLTARVANNTVTGCSVLFLKESNGSSLTSVSVCGASGTVTRTMTTTGAHSVIVDPSGANTGTADVSVTNP